MDSICMGQETSPAYIDRVILQDTGITLLQCVKVKGHFHEGFIEEY